MTVPYNYLPDDRATDFDTCVCALERGGHTVVSSYINHIDPATVEAVCAGFRDADMQATPLSIARDEYLAYYTEAGYETRFQEYYRVVISEKSFEHFVALKLLEPKAADVLIDVASEGSPLPDIFSRLSGCRSFRQDIMYPTGVHDNRIGGDACAMPVEDGFADKVSLTCSLEHFEEDGDMRLFAELGRVLKPGGRVCVVPMYVYPTASNQTDPLISVPNHIRFDREAVIYCAEGWGNRFARFYSPSSFMERIVSRCRSFFDFAVYRLTDTETIGAGIYARFAVTARRK